MKEFIGGLLFSVYLIVKLFVLSSAGSLSLFVYMWIVTSVNPMLLAFVLLVLFPFGFMFFVPEAFIYRKNSVVLFIGLLGILNIIFISFYLLLYSEFIKVDLPEYLLWTVLAAGCIHYLWNWIKVYRLPSSQKCNWR